MVTSTPVPLVFYLYTVKENVITLTCATSWFVTPKWRSRCWCPNRQI